MGRAASRTPGRFPRTGPVRSYGSSARRARRPSGRVLKTSTVSSSAWIRQLAAGGIARRRERMAHAFEIVNPANS
jgi:hypothetical protein